MATGKQHIVEKRACTHGCGCGSGCGCGRRACSGACSGAPARTKNARLIDAHVAPDNTLVVKLDRLDTHLHAAANCPYRILRSVLGRGRLRQPTLWIVDVGQPYSWPGCFGHLVDDCCAGCFVPIFVHVQSAHVGIRFDLVRRRTKRLETRVTRTVEIGIAAQVAAKIDGRCEICTLTLCLDCIQISNRICLDG